MPTFLKRDGFRYFCFSDEGDPREPAHVHVRKSGNEAKIWLEPDIRIARNKGFDARTLNAILGVVETLAEDFKGAWYEHFSE